jgi:hypothetical protein
LLYGIINRKEYIDINIYDTIFVIPQYFLLAPLMLIFFIIGMGYYLAYYSEKFKPLNWLTAIHTFFTLAGLILLFTIPQFPEKIVNDTISNLEKVRLYNDLRKFGILGFLFAQIILLVNLAISMFRR